MEDDYKARADANLRFIQTLRTEIDDQKTTYDERRQQNCDLNCELDRQRATIQDRTVEISRLKHEVQVHSDQNSTLHGQKRRTEDEL